MNIAYLILFVPLLVGMGPVSVDIDRSLVKSDEEIKRDTGGAESESAAEQRAAIARWETKVEAVRSSPPEVAIPVLGDAIASIGRSWIYQVEERFRVFDLARLRLMAIPGFADYYVKQIAEARAKTDSPWVDHQYYNICQKAMSILSTLHHPETVKALGGMLERDDDIPTLEQRKKFRQENEHSTGANPCDLALNNLSQLPLREKPKGSSPIGTTLAERRKAMREWSQEVKSGQRSFSFEGQNVSYRFKSDGSVETTPLPASEQTPVVPEKAR